jgi:DNA/RNA-binding domain of Phe-tRNA-synthetase-like protein
MNFILDPALARSCGPPSLVRRGDGRRARSPDGFPAAAAEAAVRINPPVETTAVRTMHKRVGIDPTKTRPSSEAAAAACGKGDTLPRINSMVDVCNWCSFEFQLLRMASTTPRRSRATTLRIGREGESIRHSQG